jgi:hypothetical protein
MMEAGGNGPGMSQLGSYHGPRNDGLIEIGNPFS